LYPLLEDRGRITESIRILVPVDRMKQKCFQITTKRVRGSQCFSRKNTAATLMIVTVIIWVYWQCSRLSSGERMFKNLLRILNDVMLPPRVYGPVLGHGVYIARPSKGLYLPECRSQYPNQYQYTSVFHIFVLSPTPTNLLKSSERPNLETFHMHCFSVIKQL